MKKITTFIKNEIVFSIACILALITMFFITPSSEYINYIDFHTLALLLSLMLVVQGLKSCGLFDSLVTSLMQHIKNQRQLAIMLVLLCFFSSMLTTNDVALITFIPFTIIILDALNNPAYSIYLIVLETVAANLGSMFTPIGNPQNLYLYSISGISMIDFFKLMLPYTLISLGLLFLAIYFIKPDNITTSSNAENHIKQISLLIYLILFVVCIMTVLHILDFKLMLIIVITTIFVTDYKLITKADYLLLLTFIAFFIFIGNIKQIPAVNDLLSSLVQNRECIVAILASQIVSNVPCAMLLSGFTDNTNQLIIGTNLGGLGTLIASMASLISFKFYAKTKDSNTGKYIAVFTITNIIFLIILVLGYYYISNY